jgi:thioredoxin-like negative regulator of GroEL
LSITLKTGGFPQFQEVIMAMYFYDECDELDEYRRFREQNQPLILEYERTRRALAAAEEVLAQHPEDREAEARIAGLREKLEALERQAPWLKLDYPLEYLLWGPPHG